MQKFKLHTIDSAPDGSKQHLQAAQDSMGMIPNLFAVMASSPQLLESYQTLDSLFQEAGFDKNELTVVWQTINVYHGCHYCVPAHTAIAKQMGADDAITTNIKQGDALEDSKLQALRTFTERMLDARGKVDQQAFKDFAEAGYEPKHVLAVILGIAQKTMSNYTNHVAETPLDKAFQEFK